MGVARCAPSTLCLRCLSPLALISTQASATPSSCTETRTICTSSRPAASAMYSNVIDHIMHIDRFASEARRVLVPRGTLLVHMLHQSLEQDKWAVRDMIKEHKAIDSQIVAAGFEHAVPPLHQKNYARMLIHKYVYRSTAK